MLQLTIVSTPSRITTPSVTSLAQAEPIIQGLVTTGVLSGSAGSSYLSALRSLARRVNQPLDMLCMTLEQFDERFPEDGFDPAHNKTSQGYNLWRRRTRAAIGHFNGNHVANAAARAVQDDWTDLVKTLKPFAKSRPTQWILAPQKLIALQSTLAPAARKRGLQPGDMTLAAAIEMDRAFQGNARTSLRSALETFDYIRCFPGAAMYLPPEPIGFTAEVRKTLYVGLPARWEEELQAWVRKTTVTGWDPVEKKHTEEKTAHAHVACSAFRTFLNVALETGSIRRDAPSVSSLFSSGDVVGEVCREMYCLPDRPKGQGRIIGTTVRKYLKLIRQVLEVNAFDVSILSETLKNNRQMKTAAKAEKRMTDKNRKFCEQLVLNRHLRCRFLRSFKTLREAAEAIIGKATAEGRKMTSREIARVRILGACAAFAALEIGGAPIRITNALAMTIIGDNAWFWVPETGSKPMQVKIPADATKNGIEIEFPIRRNKHGAYDTLRWYLREIRPLFPNVTTSPYLFPAIQQPDSPFPQQRFRAEFSNAMRELVNLPMTPHQMRHGQTSLLYNRFPEDIETIAKRGEHTVETLRRHYAWIDSQRFMSRGQDMMMELMDADA